MTRTTHLRLIAFLALVVFGGCQRGQFGDHAHCLFIGTNLANCQVLKDSFPDNIYDQQGNPLLSWRVVSLKYGSESDAALYRQFRLDEPWNSPHNLAVAQEIPETYRDPRGSKFTPYLAVMGEKGAFRPHNPRPWKSLDAHSALVVTVRDSDVFWSEPRDISPEEAEKGDRLRWERARTIYVSGAFIALFWDKNNPGMCPKPKFEYELEPPAK